MNEIEKAQQEITDARDKLASAEARLSALSKTVDREYRAGEWVPAMDTAFYTVMPWGNVCRTLRSYESPADESTIAIGNAFPTEAIAKSAKAHADWWCEFDMSDEGGEFYFWVSCDLRIVTAHMDHAFYDEMPRFQSYATMAKAIERLGGEQKVIEMLNKGRVFRFKWGGQ